MKKALVLASLLALGTSVFAEEIEKVGFLTTKWCADNGLFTDCRMETVLCGEANCFKKENEFSAEIRSKLVLFVHDEAKAYYLEFAPGFHMGELLEKSINKNEVTIVGELNGNSIQVSSYEAPPPPKKSFFKGCL